MHKFLQPWYMRTQTRKWSEKPLRRLHLCLTHCYPMKQHLLNGKTRKWSGFMGWVIKYHDYLMLRFDSHIKYYPDFSKGVEPVMRVWDRISGCHILRDKICEGCGVARRPPTRPVLRDLVRWQRSLLDQLSMGFSPNKPISIFKFFIDFVGWNENILGIGVDRVCVQCSFEVDFLAKPIEPSPNPSMCE